MKLAFSEILDRTRKFAHNKGAKNVATFVNGTLCRNAIVYADEVVHVAVDPLSKEMQITRVENKNPVVCVDEDGQTYRYHGEFNHVEGHLLGLINGG